MLKISFFQMIFVTISKIIMFVIYIFEFTSRFLSGSRDGTAVIWYYKNGEWQAKCLDASMRVEGYVNYI